MTMRLRSRSILIALVLGALVGPVQAAEPPAAMRLQASFATATGVPASGTFKLTITVYSSQSGGSVIHAQVFDPVTVVGGVFEVDLTGINTALLASAADAWVETRVDAEPPLPRQRLLSTPFALRSGTAQTAAGLACSGCVDTADIAASAITGAQIADGAIASADVDFPWAEGKTKGGAAANLDCVGCVGAVDLASGSVGSAHIVDGSVAKEDVAFNYAKSNAKDGDALGLACTGCVTSAHLASNLTLDGDTSFTGSVLACTSGTAGCRVQLSNKGGLYDPADGSLNLQANGGLRVRTLNNGAWAALQAGTATVNGAASVTGTLSVATTSTTRQLNVGTGMRITHPTLGNMDLVLNNSPTASSLQVVPSGSGAMPDLTIYREDGNPAVHVETSNGRMGIGTTAPAVALDVAGDVRGGAGNAAFAQLSTDGAVEVLRSTTPYIDFKDTVADDYDVRLQQVDDGLRIRTGGSGAAAERVVVDKSGRVGIGTVTPEATLDVNGSTMLRGTVDATNNRLTGVYLPQDKHGAGAYNVVGYHYDSLIAADKKFSVSVPGGASGGSVAEMFDGHGSTSLTYPGGAAPVSVTINMGMQHYWHAVGVYFPYGYSIKGIKAEKFYDPNSGNGWSCSDPGAKWETIAETTTFTGADWFATGNLGNGICQLRFTFSGALNNPGDGNFRLGEIQAWRQGHYGDDGLYVTRTGTGGNRIYSPITVDGQIAANGGVDYGSGANDDLTAADVTTLTGGGNADSLHTHASASAPKGWVSIGTLDQIFSLVNTYPMSDYQYGVYYNTVLGEVTEIVCSSWNAGYRCISKTPYMIGDYQSQYALGGIAFFWGTLDAWDDGCNAGGAWLHQYFGIGSGTGWAGGITFIGGNGCVNPTMLVRPR